MVVDLGYGSVSTTLGGFLGRGSELIGVDLGYGCGLIDSVVGCCGLCRGLRLWVVPCVEAMGC